MIKHLIFKTGTEILYKKILDVSVLLSKKPNKQMYKEKILQQQKIPKIQNFSKRGFCKVQV